MAAVTPENVFEPHLQQYDDEGDQAVKQLLQDIAREAFLILHKMQLTCSSIDEKTGGYQNQLKLNKGNLPAKSRAVFVDILAAIEQYHDHISQYHALLNTDVCSYQIPLWAYKQLRHQLVIRIVQDVRTVKRLVDGFSRLRSRKNSINYLMNRWQRELVNFSVLAI
jgi:hypothetical protein